MRHTSSHSKSGFTLVEMLIVAPIVILMIGIFISSIVAMTGDVLSTRSATTLSYDVQDALDRIEQDVKASGGYLSKNNVVIKSPQGFNNGSTNFFNVNSDPSIGDMLILNSYATTSNPAGSSDNIMYMSGQPYACDSTQVSLNTPVTYNIVYFVKNNTLWRRVLMPSNYQNVGCNGTSVGLPWQQPSCLPTITGTMCVTEDIKLVDGVDADDFQISYLTDSGSTTENTVASDTAQSDTTRQSALKTTAAVSVTITASDSTAGRPVTHTGTMRATSNNNYFEPTADTGWTEFNMGSGWTNFNSSHNSNGYRRTKDGVVILKGLIKKSTAIGVDEIIATLPEGYRPHERLIFSTATNSNVSSRIDIDTSGNIIVVAGNASWLSLNGIKYLAADRSSDFINLPPLSPWFNAGSPYSSLSYATDGSGRVHTTGRIYTNSATAPGTPIMATMPSSVRPPEYTHFEVSNGSGFGFISINASNGDITPKVTAASTWYIAIQTMYYPVGYTNWTSMKCEGSWVEYSSSYKPAYTKSADGIVTLKGLVKSGTTGTYITYLPPGYRPAKQTLMNTVSNGVFSRIDIYSDGGVYFSSGDPGWVSLDGMSFYADQ